jgi:hypothetical protein
MSTVAAKRKTGKPSAPGTPGPADEAHYRELQRIGHTGDAPADPIDQRGALDAAVWITGQARGLGVIRPDEQGAAGLAADELRLLARLLAVSGRLPNVPEYVPVPDPNDYRENPLAYRIATLTALLYPYQSAAARLAARALVNLADSVVLMGSRTAQEYLADEATARGQAINAMMGR